MQLLYLDRKFTLYTLSVMDLVVGNSKNSWLTDWLIDLFICVPIASIVLDSLYLFIFLWGVAAVTELLKNNRAYHSLAKS